MTADDLNTLRDEVAEVLAAHVLREVDPACSCGWDWNPREVILPSEVDFDPSRYRLSNTIRPEQHRAHVADALLPLLARVRDEARGHPEDYCHRCGGRNISWYTPGGTWDPVMRSDGESGKWSEIVCPQCFVELAGGGTWALIPMKDDGERWTSADEREQVAAVAYERGLAEGEARVRARLRMFVDADAVCRVHGLTLDVDACRECYAVNEIRVYDETLRADALAEPTGREGEK